MALTPTPEISEVCSGSSLGRPIAARDLAAVRRRIAYVWSVALRAAHCMSANG